MHQLTKLGLPAALLLAWALPVTAQQPGPIAQVFFQRAKPGMTQQYEQGRKRHVEWHKKQNDPWTWNVWQVSSGPNLGGYVVATGDHHWKDFDGREQFDAADGADSGTNIAPYAEGTTISYYTVLPQISRPPASPDPSAMAQLIHFQLRGGADAEFTHAIRRIHEAIQKTNWPANYIWYSLVNGGEPEYVAVLPRNKWAELEPLDPPLPAMIEKAFGRAEADTVLQILNRTIRRQWSEMLTYRADLSYRPAARVSEAR